jgi:hypothetical protein
LYIADATETSSVSLSDGYVFANDANGHLFTGSECENDNQVPVPVLIIANSGTTADESCSYQTEGNNIDSYCIEADTAYSISTSQLEPGVASYQLGSGASAVSVSGNTFYIENAIGSCDDETGQVSGYQFVSDDTYSNTIDSSAELYHIVESRPGHVYRIESSDLGAGQSVGDVGSGDTGGVVIQCVDYVGNDVVDRTVSPSAIIDGHSHGHPFTSDDLDMTVEDHSSAGGGGDNLASTTANQTIVGLTTPLVAVSGAKQTVGSKPYIVVPSSVLSSAMLESLQNQHLVVAASNNGRLAESQQVVYQLANSSIILQAPVQLKQESMLTGLRVISFIWSSYNIVCLNDPV